MQTEKNIWLRMLSMILTLALLISCIPNQVYAMAGEALAELMEQEETAETIETPNKTKRGVYEATERREANVKHFALEDGTYTAVMYGSAVHTQDAEGNWQDIDNRLSDSGSEFSTSNARIKFAKKITGNETLFTLHDGNRKITMSLNNAIKKTVGAVTNHTTEFDSEATQLQKLMTLDNLSSEILYVDILDGVDLQYVVESLNVKENIIVKERKDSYQYTFTVALNNLEAEMAEDGSVRIYDPGTRKTVYNIPAGFMYDANGEYSPAVVYTLTTGGNGKYSLTVNADAAWINAEERAFPVVIDPTISPAYSTNSFDATFISSSAINASNDDLGYLEAGTNSIAYWKMHTLPTLPEGYYITDASFIAERYGTDSLTYDIELGVYQVISNWDVDTFCYSQYTSQGTGQHAEYASDAGRGSNQSYQFIWDITQIVRSWYNAPSSNYGIAIRCPNTSTAILSYRFTLGNKALPIRITYKPIIGLEDYWSYATQIVGMAGTGYVNKATGELTFAIGTLSTTDALFGHTTSLVYNQAYAGQHVIYGNANVPLANPTCGYGMKLNVNESLTSKSYVDTFGDVRTYYIWTDSDGTEHEFYPDGDTDSVYKDVDGLLLTLTVNGRICEITDMSHNVRTFTKSGVDRTKVIAGFILQSITDQNGNKLSYVYLEDGKISKIQVVPNGSSAITYFEYEYNSYGQIKQINSYNLNTGPKVKFYYSTTSSSGSLSQDNQGYLKKIEFINEGQIVATTYYSYDSSGRLVEARDDASGYYVCYSYSGNRVSSITEYAGEDETVGQTITFSYKDGSTEIRSSGSDDEYGTNDDIITVYVFDGFGRVISTYSTDIARTIIYGASSGEYETQENVKNNLKVSATMGGVANNFLFNGGFEKIKSSKAVGWESTNIAFNSTNIPLYENSSAEAHLASSKTAELKQYVRLPEGQYTLSFDARSYKTPDVTFRVFVALRSDETTIIAQHEVPINKYGDNRNFVTQSMHFETEKYDTDEFVVIFQITGKSGTAYSSSACITIDNVLLEESIGHSPYNIIQFGSFDSSCLTKTNNLTPNLYEYWSTGGAQIHYDSLMGNVLELQYNGVTNRHIATQYITTGRNSNVAYEETAFIISGMAKGTQQYASGVFEMKARVQYEDNTWDTIPFKFQYTCTEWQYVSGIFVTQAKPIETISVSLVYQNPGVCYFDNIYLTQVIDESTVFNEYDEQGRVIVRKNGYYEEIYEYDEANNVTRMANDRGELYDYEYNSAGMPTRTTYYTYARQDGEVGYPKSAENPDALIVKTLLTRTDYTYNAYGQLLTTKSYDATTIAAAENKVTSSYTYNTTVDSRYFGALLTETDNLGITTRYFYDVRGQLQAVINTSTQTGTCYTYDLLGNITSVMPATWTGSGNYEEVDDRQKIEYTYNDANLLEELRTQTTIYQFSYDCFGKQESISVGNSSNPIVSYVYNEYNGKLKEIHYANGFVVKYTYDELENVSEVRYTTEGSQTDTLAYVYAYDAYGQLYRFDNKLTGTSIIYRYDTNRRLVGYVEFDVATNTNKFSATILYGENAQVSDISYAMDYMSRAESASCTISYQFIYDGDGTLRDYMLESDAVSGVVNFIYDDFKRISTKTYDFSYSNSTTNKFVNTVSYAYQTANGNTSTQVYQYTTEIDNKGDINPDVSVTYTYTYDDRGNVIKIQTSTGQEFRYVYDDLDQLLREDNTAQGKTYVYTYDLGGNILTKKVYSLTAEGVTPSNPTQTYTYGYGDPNWGDKLTSFNNASFAYDANGNPTAYNNGTAWAFTWIHGSRLSTAVGNGTTITFAYNDDGIRTEKTVGSVKHTYTLNGSQIISEAWENHLLIYLYDIDGMPIGMQYRSRSYSDDRFDVYWFERNLQGDILAVYDQRGTKLISYTYDAWGNVTTSYHNGCTSSSAANYNPFRYRGYYYDTELRMYYLQTRYYDPAIGRFLNADAYVASDSSVLGCNMFAYCGNNPVMGYDPTGEFSWGKLFSGASLLAIGITACAAAVTVVTAGACTPLLVAACATFVAGGMTVINGAAEVIESGTDYNFVRDGLLDGNEELYEAQKEFFSTTAEIGTMVITMGSASGKLCFAAGTVVLLNEGRKAIEDIVVGDYVWAWDEETGEKTLRRVTETYVNQTSELVHVFVGGEEIVTTPTHPFYSPVKGWTDAARLRAGDILVLVNGEYVVVERVQHEILESPINVYNFQVAGDHTYYVSDVGVLVHNGCFDPSQNASQVVLLDNGSKAFLQDAGEYAGQYIAKDFARHGNSAFKLFRKVGNKSLELIGDLAADGTRILAKHSSNAGKIYKIVKRITL